MKRMLGILGSVIFLVLAPMLASAQEQQKVVTLGADLTPEQRTELIQRLGVNEANDKIVTVSVDEMRAAMQNIIPVPEGYTSVSSTALRCTDPGSGLRVTTSNITRVSAAMYAAALITAGIGDAEMMVAAPQNAEAEGMTALTGLFKGLEGGVCGRGEVDPKRRELAYRQLALAADIADSTGGDTTKSSDLLMRAQQSLVEQKNNADQAGPIADKVQSDIGVTLPQPQKDALVQLLGDMARANIDWGNYASGWDIQNTSATEVTVKAKGVGAPTGAGKSVTGSAKSLADDGTLRLAVDGTMMDFAAGNVPVTRNGQPAKISDLQINDTVVVELDANNKPLAIRATSGGQPAGGAGRTITGRASVVAQNNTLSLDVNGQKQEFAATNVPVTRNGQPAQLSDIQVDDTVAVDVNANNQPTAIRATSNAGSGFNLRRWWWLCLLPLIPLLFLLLGRRRRREEVVVVENRADDSARRTTIIQKNQADSSGGARQVDIIEDDTNLG